MQCRDYDDSFKEQCNEILNHAFTSLLPSRAYSVHRDSLAVCVCREQAKVQVSRDLDPRARQMVKVNNLASSLGLIPICSALDVVMLGTSKTFLAQSFSGIVTQQGFTDLLH